jgi:hypothetical protein
MPQRSKGPRLWLQPARRGKDGRVITKAVWVVRDGDIKISTGAGEHDVAAAEQALHQYLIAKHRRGVRINGRDPASVHVADVIEIYATDIAPKHMNPAATGARLYRLLEFFEHKTLADVNKSTCDMYVRHRGAGHVGGARRELEDLRAAIRHHWELGLCTALTPVVPPKKGGPRTRWLTRAEAARLLRAAWRARAPRQGRMTAKPTARHIARFILLGLYTGSRAGAIASASFTPAEGRSWVDLDHGVFYRLAAGARETKKRQPSVRGYRRACSRIYAAGIGSASPGGTWSSSMASRSSASTAASATCAERLVSVTTSRRTRCDIRQRPGSRRLACRSGRRQASWACRRRFSSRSTATTAPIIRPTR